MRRSLLIALAAPLLGLAAFAAPAAAQTWGRYDGGYSYDSGPYDGGRGHARGYDGYRRDTNAVPSSFDWRGQLDRPGDYRCDPFWDANRTDCGARWRDQRHRVSPQARRDYRALAGYRSDEGYGYGYSRGYDRYGGYDHGYRRRGYGSSYGSGYAHAQGGTAYEGAYGRPDIVFPGGRRSYADGRDPRRVDWCRASYRSYDPASGYYRAYSGRLIWCG
jgi:hypothetical protein